ncbi:MAG TPA: UDP-3-O-(3-hydroxymyristoyl)glucosamine N-acyltransferase [Syntrophales bacterium]|nr:UDP-3-O-(3-hydroxymyristoyl)glucosamine N-acyltransferase [Syntrophales bacterium]HOX93666.1 UDP-3-O-(3-hydroxymyristoyl)glucosamine N-acyltransferase [Syntrophales bacterium]HPI57372.1 UDP-3-O-(3-hydroxymyristoyl)glucosamine N-acyltransferase [Syntrophales bacterium]HPN25436.1 UDP-3-O-(3-hydroxymyristoyl)glucosamine N-acyltransferase [Syntrophales bacterium]HQM29918.1 UDP-3-O-(3-hydroxymyristoyl)glucosamine N-acyltransferase [Syntrophales bacterium]
MKKTSMTLREIAAFLNGSVRGDGDTTITGVQGIDEAREGDLTFVANPKYQKKIASTRASAIIVARPPEGSDRNFLVVKDPYMAMARVLSLFYPEEKPLSGISRDAVVEEGAQIGEGVAIGPNVFVGRGARIGRGVTLYPGTCIGHDTLIGEDSVLYPNVTVYRRSIIGKRVVLHAGVVVGSDGFGFANPGRDNFKVPQAGYVQIDDDVEIGANTTIDRGTLGKTWIQRGVKIDNLVQIAHNVVIGENSIVVAQVGISGSTKLGRSVVLGGQAGLIGHITIGDGVMIAAQSGVARDIPPGQIVSGSPTMPHQEWLRLQVHLSKMPELRNTVTSLLKRVEALEKKKA